MGIVRAQRALGLASIVLLTVGAWGSLFAGAWILAGIFTGLLAVISAWSVLRTCRACAGMSQRAEAAEDRLSEAESSLAGARALLAGVLDGFPHPVAMVSVGGRIELANGAAAALGLTPGAALAALPAWVREAAAGSAMPAGVGVNSEAGAMPRDGDPIRVPGADLERLFVSRAVPLKGAGASPGVLVILTDVTDARQAGEARSKLLSTLSHDLKTPMTSIQMSIHLLLEDAAGRLSARQVEFLQAARDDAYKLHQLIEEMVGAARSRG